MWREPGADPEFDALLELDLATVVPSLAGPRRPQDRVVLQGLPENFRAAYPDAPMAGPDAPGIDIEVGEQHAVIRTGSVAIAAITSCTNT